MRPSAGVSKHDMVLQLFSSQADFSVNMLNKTALFLLISLKCLYSKILVISITILLVKWEKVRVQFTRGTEHFSCSKFDCKYTELLNISFTVFSYYGGHDSSWTRTETNQSQSQTKNGSPCWSVWQRWVCVLLVIWVHVLKLRPIFLRCSVVCCNCRAWGPFFWGVKLFAAIVGPEAHFSGVLSCLLQL